MRCSLERIRAHIVKVHYEDLLHSADQYAWRFTFWYHWKQWQ